MKDLGASAFSYGYACPVLMAATYNDDGTVNVMNLHEVASQRRSWGVNNDRGIMFCAGKFSALHLLHDVRNDAAARLPAV